MQVSKITFAIVSTVAVTLAGAAFAGVPTVTPIIKSSQALPPIPPGITAIFGPNAALVVGTVGIPGIVVATVVISGVLYSVIINDNPNTTTTTTTTTR